MTEKDNEAPIVHIVDDDDGVRYALMRLFNDAGFENRTYISGDEFIETFSAGHVGCLVVDIRMPGMSGLEVLSALKDKGIRMPVIVITGHGDVKTGVQAMKSGAFDFIEKPFSDETLLDAVQTAIKQHTQQRASAQQRDRVAKMFAALSNREREVLDEMLKGEPNKRIAGNLNLSEKTIEFHRANIMKKMASHSFADLIKKTLLVIPLDSADVLTGDGKN